MTIDDEAGRPTPSGRMRLLGTRPAIDPPGEDPGQRRPRLRRTRSIIAWVLIVLAVLLVPLSVVTVWAVNTVTETNHYVETLAPLAREKVITDYVAARATDRLFEGVGVQKKIANVLPKRASFLSNPLTNTLHGFVYAQLQKLLETTWFHNLWDTVNRRSHAAVVNVLTGKVTPGKRANQVVVNLTPVLDKAIDQLDARGVTVFDGLKPALQHADTLTLQLASSRQVSKARQFFRFASDLGWAAPLLAVIAIVAAVAVAIDRRKALLRIAVGVVLLSLLLLGVLALGRNFFVDHAADKIIPTVSGAIWDVLLRFLRDNLRTVTYISAGVAILLWLVGPARWPRWLRAQAVRGVRWVGRRGAELGNEQNRRYASAKARAGAGWALEHASGLRLIGAIVAGIILVFGGNLSVSGVWWTAVGIVLYLLLLELIFAWARRTAARTASAPTGGALPPPGISGPSGPSASVPGPALAGATIPAAPDDHVPAPPDAGSTGLPSGGGAPA